jgi:hypothetical protein
MIGKDCSKKGVLRRKWNNSVEREYSCWERKKEERKERGGGEGLGIRVVNDLMLN